MIWPSGSRKSSGSEAGRHPPPPARLSRCRVTQTSFSTEKPKSGDQGKAFRQLEYLSPPVKIANRTVTDEYFAVTAKVEALYQPGHPLPADAIGPRMARLRREHHRLLGNGYSTRPPELD